MDWQGIMTYCSFPEKNSRFYRELAQWAGQFRKSGCSILGLEVVPAVWRDQIVGSAIDVYPLFKWSVSSIAVIEKEIYQIFVKRMV